jgi:hypothetical protein
VILFYCGRIVLIPATIIICMISVVPAAKAKKKNISGNEQHDYKYGRHFCDV